MLLTQRPSAFRLALVAWAAFCICVILYHFSAIRTHIAPTADLLRQKASEKWSSVVSDGDADAAAAAFPQTTTTTTPTLAAKPQEKQQDQKQEEQKPQKPKPKQPKQIPKKLWYKTGPKGLTDDMRAWHDSCTSRNSHYRATYLNDDSADAYVQENYAAERPDVVDAYMGLAIPILKADFLRYLLLYREGGVWFDLDVSCETVPIDEWIPDEYKNDTAIAVGWEFDVGWGEGFQRQFNSWTIMSEQGSPHMLQVIDDIVAAVGASSRKHGVPVGNLTLDMVGDVVDYTGPRRMTEGIFRSLERQRGGDKIDRAELSNLRQPKMIGDVLILPGYSLAMSSNKYEGEQVGPSLVTHHYAGSWKNDKGGETKRRRRKRRGSSRIEA
ncbi:uncharacterized protein E0L32_000389 [Thyridium curvatum]|uniref:Initiation-specific alpha-1,6-mannosyltransferase n=1 Tax=Thyridium curvatum TaxID=1093900 RepID=A0A507AZ02_9PEZI|nr:uncharacterized protein E0L32_000389 [Thyridium curvatum]TPX16055.1 hypothetical protein E0L32_000389 [Thyridium curvatum]